MTWWYGGGGGEAGATRQADRPTDRPFSRRVRVRAKPGRPGGGVGGGVGGGGGRGGGDGADATRAFHHNTVPGARVTWPNSSARRRWRRRRRRDDDEARARVSGDGSRVAAIDPGPREPAAAEQLLSTRRRVDDRPVQLIATAAARDENKNKQ